MKLRYKLVILSNVLLIVALAALSNFNRKSFEIRSLDSVWQLQGSAFKPMISTFHHGEYFSVAEPEWIISNMRFTDGNLAYEVPKIVPNYFFNPESITITKVEIKGDGTHFLICGGESCGSAHVDFQFHGQELVSAQTQDDEDNQRRLFL